MANGQKPLAAAVEEIFEYLGEQAEKLEQCKPRFVDAATKIETGSYDAASATRDLTEGFAHALVEIAGMWATALDVLTIASEEAPPGAIYTVECAVRTAAPSGVGVRLRVKEANSDAWKGPPLEVGWFKIDPETYGPGVPVAPTVTVTVPSAQPRARYTGVIDMVDDQDGTTVVGDLVFQVTVA